jgi:hypothetical protein
MENVRVANREPAELPPLRKGQPLPLRKGLVRLNRKYARTLERLAK